MLKIVCLMKLIFWILLSISTCLEVNAQSKIALIVLGEGHLASQKQQLEDISLYFQSKQIRVIKMFYPNTEWSKIVSVAKDCDLFVYAGHGCSNCGLDGEYGGLVLNEFITANRMQQELRFLNQPLVIILNSCGAAGTASDDDKTTTKQILTKRILDTATPYFTCGAKGYFASNWYNEYQVFLDNYLINPSLKTSFDLCADWETHSINYRITNKGSLSNKLFGVKYSIRDGRPYFSTAFIGSD